MRSYFYGYVDQRVLHVGDVICRRKIVFLEILNHSLPVKLVKARSNNRTLTRCYLRENILWTRNLTYGKRCNYVQFIYILTTLGYFRQNIKYLLTLYILTSTWFDKRLFAIAFSSCVTLLIAAILWTDNYFFSRNLHVEKVQITAFRLETSGWQTWERGSYLRETSQLQNLKKVSNKCIL